MKRLGNVTFILITLYALTAGATFNGLLTANTRLLSAGLMALFAAIWLAARLRAPRRWQPSALDVPIVLWLVAFALSLAANLDQWRRIAEGLWYMGLYVALWYTLHDWIAARQITRRLLIDALLVAGVPVVFAGLAQVWVWLQGGGLAGPIILRPVSIFGNPNTLGAFLVVLLPLTLDRILNTRSRTLHDRLARTLYAVLLVLSLLLLAMSFSRGGWIGAGVAFAVYAALTLRVRELAHLWTTRRRWVVGGGIILAVGVAVVAWVGVNSLNTAGRTFDLRTFIWNTALESFASKPLTGYGLFTFGGQLALRNSTPFTEPHSHAHSLPLNLAAELGIIGLIALLVTVVYTVRAFVRNWYTAAGIERGAITAAGAAAVGLAVHHLLDLPAMNPAIALTGLFVLIAALAPLVSQDKDARVEAHTPLFARLCRLSPALLVALWAGLIVTGIGGALVYRRYMDILSQASAGDFRSGAEAMRGIVALDPDMPIYTQQEGLLWALTAYYQPTSDSVQIIIPNAIAAFERYTSLAPQYAIGWANLGALYAADAQWGEASDAMCRAADLAPEVSGYWWRCGEYSEASGSDEAALAAYAQTLTLRPDTALYPRWHGSALREQAAAVPVTLPADAGIYARVVSAVRAGMTPLEAARALPADAVPTRMREYFLVDWPALADRDTRPLPTIPPLGEEMRDERAWEKLYQRYMHGVSDGSIVELLAGVPYEDEFAAWANINYIQFLHLTMARQHVPQMEYPLADGLLAFILADDAAGGGDLPPVP